jgi:hypothetical protein
MQINISIVLALLDSHPASANGNSSTAEEAGAAGSCIKGGLGL